MAAPKKVTREMIIEAGLKVLREDGYQAINARSIAAKGNISTQPIYNEFANMEDLKDILRKEAEALYFQMIKEYMKLGKDYEYMSYGLGFVRFAREEKQLFRYLYLESQLDNRLVQDSNYDSIIAMMENTLGWSKDACQKFHMDMSLYTYGLAITAYIGQIPMTDEEVANCLSRQFTALSKVYELQ